MAQLTESDVEYGECVVRWWEDIPRHFVPVDIDAFVVMPNHVHGIILITDPPVGAGSPRPGPRIADAATGVATDAREGAKTAGADKLGMVTDPIQ